MYSKRSTRLNMHSRTPGEVSDPAAEDLRIQLFRQYLIAEEDEGFEGSFADFAGEDLAAELQLQEEEAEPEAEEVELRLPRCTCMPPLLLIWTNPSQVQPRSDAEACLLATADNAQLSQHHFTALEGDSMRCLHGIASSLSMNITSMPQIPTAPARSSRIIISAGFNQ